MKSFKFSTALAVFTLATAVFSTGCKKDDPSPENPIVIPLQTTVSGTVVLAGASGFAVLSGSAVTSTGATAITGDLGLSPGTSLIGFPPAILTGTQHINDAAASLAKGLYGQRWSPTAGHLRQFSYSQLGRACANLRVFPRRGCRVCYRHRFPRTANHRRAVPSAD